MQISGFGSRHSLCYLPGVPATTVSMPSDAGIIRVLVQKTRAGFASGHSSPFGSLVIRSRTQPPFFDYNAEDFVANPQFKWTVEGPVERTLCRALVDDAAVQKDMDRLAKKDIRS